LIDFARCLLWLTNYPTIGTTLCGTGVGLAGFLQFPYRLRQLFCAS